MPVEKYASYYKMDHKRRGLALIFNHEVFECGGLKSRAGTNEDCKNLKALLNSLGFEVHVFKDLKHSEIEKHIESGEYLLVPLNFKDLYLLDHGRFDLLNSFKFQPENPF